jgi:hypothetical protein
MKSLIMWVMISNLFKKMTKTRWTYFLLTLACLLLAQRSHGQITNDAATYWVNVKYLDCIDSGSSVCYCQEQSNFLILHIDTIENRLTIKPSIYHSWETLEFNTKRNKVNSFEVLPAYGIDSGSTFNIKANQLMLTTPKEMFSFKKIIVKRIDRGSIHGDIWRQIGAINCKPLLKYHIKLCGDNTTFPLTTEKLSEYISSGQATISCSDDYQYNELYIRSAQTGFFLVYENNFIKAFKEPEPRDRGHKIDTTKLKDCQLFYKID